jgi:hypothetical protein
VRAQTPRLDSGRHRIQVSAFPAERFPDDWTYDAEFVAPGWLVPESDREQALRDFDPTDPISLSDDLGQLSIGATERQVVPRTCLEAAFLTCERKHRPLGPRMGVEFVTGRPDPGHTPPRGDGEFSTGSRCRIARPARPPD